MIFIFGLDEGFVLPTGIAIRSLDRFLSSSDQIVLLHDQVGPDSLAKLRDCASHGQVSEIDCHTLLEDSWRPPSHVTNAAFIRYLAPRLLQGESRCVYTDGDVIFRRDPGVLHQMDLQGTTLGAVRSRAAPYFASPGAIEPWLEMGLPSSSPYFNSGVLVIDLDRWRSLDITGRITDVMKRFGDRLNLADQDALNASVVGDWTQLDRTWNYVTHIVDSFLQQPELEPLDPAIVHFAGRTKPWRWGRQPLFAEEWYALIEDSPWQGFRPLPPTDSDGFRASARRRLRDVLKKVRDVATEP